MAAHTTVRKNDTVEVLIGKDRGKRGRVLRVLPEKGKAVVEQVNLVKRHTRPNPQKNVKGGILDKEAPISIANVGVVCKSCDRGVRLATRRGTDGTATRSCVRCGTSVEK